MGNVMDRIFSQRTVQEKLVVMNKEYSEVSLEAYDDGSARFYCNPYEGQVWNVISDLQYLDGLTGFNVSFAEDMNEDYDIVDIKWVEPYIGDDIHGQYIIELQGD